MLNVSLSDLAMHSIDKCAGNNTNLQRLFLLGHSQITLEAGTNRTPKILGLVQSSKLMGWFWVQGLRSDRP